jgi:alpha-D-ribose 1-methylphosphonate 5-triphosphate synthase subunit PhnG
VNATYSPALQSATLGTLNRAPAQIVKDFVDGLLEQIENAGLEVVVLENRTGLVMLPAVDNAHGTTFHMGEVLVSEGRVRVGNHHGYTACLGRDLEQALAVAILDACLIGNVQPERIAAFVEDQSRALELEDELLLRDVESTRVEMETF